jgi:hypothetical protein
LQNGVFGVRASSRAQIVSLQKLQGQLQDELVQTPICSTG